MQYHKVPHFLRSADHAYRWALKYVDDMETRIEDLDNLAPGAGEQHFRELASLYSELARTIYSAGEAELFRAVRVQRDEKGVPIISTSKIGKAWSSQVDGAGVYGMAPDREATGFEDVLLTGIVKPSSIDWKYGYTSFMYYGTDQWEVSLLSNVPVLLTHLDGEPLDPLIEANTGMAEETWEA